MHEVGRRSRTRAHVLAVAGGDGLDSDTVERRGALATSVSDSG